MPQTGLKTLGGRTAKIALPVALVTGALAIFFYFNSTRPTPPVRPQAERIWTVDTVSGASASIQPELVLYGEIIAGREAELRPLVAGRIVEVADQLRNGGQVRSGDLLLAIDRFDFETAVTQRRADVKEIRSRLHEIKNDLVGETRLLAGDKTQAAISRNDAARRAKLGARGASSQKAIDDSKLALTEREQKVLSRQLSLSRLRTKQTQTEAVFERAEAALRRAMHDLDDTRLVAPFDGFLLDTNAAVGRLVGIKDQVARLIDVGRLEARFQLNNAQFARLIGAEGLKDGGLTNRRAIIRWRTGARDFTFSGTVDRVESRIDPAAGGVRAYATLTTQGLDTPIRPGAFIEVRIPDRRYDGVVSIPQQALHDNARVYTIAGPPEKDGTRLTARAVTVAARTQGLTLIRGTFAADERIVTTRFPEMGPGVRVRMAPPSTVAK